MADKSTKVLVAAAFSPANLVLLGGSVALSTGTALFVWWLVGAAVGVGGLLAYARSVTALARDPNFARQALAAGSLETPALTGGQRLEIFQRVGRLPESYKPKIAQLVDLSKDVEGRLEAGTGSYLDGAMKALAPQVRAALDEAAGLAVDGAERENDGKDTTEAQVRLDRIVEILQSMKGDLLMMETSPEQLGEDSGGVVLQLEDLSGELKVLKDSLEELDG